MSALTRSCMLGTLLLTTFWGSCIATASESDPTTSAVTAAEPVSGFVDGVRETPNQPGTLQSDAVPTQLTPGQGRSGTTRETLDLKQTLTPAQLPSRKTQRSKYRYVGLDGSDQNQTRADTGPEIRALQTTITAGGTVTNINNTSGNLFIPADPHGAAGPNHVVNVFNVSIEFYQKDGTQDFSDDLQAFFSALSPANFTFDPKVVYDQHEDRWVVVTLERTDVSSGSPSNTSLVLVAVSDDSDPNGSWTVTEINTSININGDDHWLDYPGLGVDEEAIYITGNMFQYFGGTSSPGAFGGNRLVIIDKGVVGGFYGGGPVSASIFNHTALAGGFTVTQMPAQVYGNPGGVIGTWLVGYSGLSNGVSEAVQLIRIDNPLSATPTFTLELPFIGDVDNTAGGGIPDAPQSGGLTPIDSGDRRVIDALWRDDSIYFTTEVLPGSGPDIGEATSFWGQMDTSAAAVFVQGNTIGGDSDIGPDTHTSYPSIAVNDDGGIVVGFSASSSSTFPSAYFVNRSPTDPLGSMRPATLIRAGEAGYVRTFGGPDNRWGDYSATAVDPDEACFWVYNKFATTQGNPTSGGEVGRYLTVHAQFCNDTPVAVGDSATVDNAGTVTMVNGTDTSLIANDSDVDEPDDTLSMNTTAVSGPSNGVVVLNANGSFSYTHNGTATTSDSFVYRVCDDGSPSLCADGTVSITINAGANQPPMAVGDSLTVDEAGTSSVLDGSNTSVLDNDSDPDDPVLTATLNTDVVNGSLNLNSNGTFSYTHNGSETTSDSFSYDACDDELPTPACDTATVSITVTPVNDPPVAVDDSASVDEGGVVTTLDGGSVSVLDGDTDPDSSSFVVSLETDVVNGTLNLLTTGEFSYTHDGSETTSDSFEYEICDDGTPALCDIGLVSITVTLVNDPPTAVDDSITVAEGGTATMLDTGAASVLDGDTDPDSSSFVISLQTDVINGSLNLMSNGEFSYTHNGSETSSDSFEYEICDDGTPALCDIGLVSITVTPVNDPPVASNDSASVAEGGTVSTLDGGALSVLDGDTDPDSSTFVVSLQTDVVNGSLNLMSTGEFSYTHNGSETLSDSFEYEICDDGTPALCDIGLVSITVTPVNDPPVAVDDSASVAEGGTVSTLDGGAVSVLDGDTDPDSSSFVISLETDVSNGTLNLLATGEFSYTHDGSETTSDSFEYEICDDGTPALCDIGLVSITVTAVNDAPVAVDDAASVLAGQTVTTVNGGQSSLLDNDSDAENDTLSLQTAAITPPAHGALSLNSNGSFSYTHNGNGQLTDSFVYRLCDDGTPIECDDATVTVAIIQTPEIFEDGFED